MAEHNPWEDLIRASNDITFATLRPRGGPRAFQDFFRSDRGRSLVEDRFNQRIGSLALAGEAPNLDLFDFLQDFDFRGAFQDLTPRDRGVRSTPRLRFLNFGGR